MQLKDKIKVKDKVKLKYKDKYKYKDKKEVMLTKYERGFSNDVGRKNI